MKRISLALIAALLVTGVSCNRDPKVVAQGYVQKGNRYFDAGRELQARDPEAAARRYKEAALMYRKAIAKNKTSGDAWYRLSQAEYGMGHVWPEGVNALRYAISLNPENAKAIVQLSEFYLLQYLGTQKDEWKKEYLLLMAKLKQNTVEWYRVKGAEALYINRDFKSAGQHYGAANAAMPLNPEIVFPLVQALAKDNQQAGAEKLALATIAKEKQFEPLYDFLADSYLGAKRLQEAESILKLKVANNPKSLLAVRGLARFYWGAKRLPEMTQTIDRLADAKTFPNGRLAAGEFFSGLGDYESAIRYLRPGMSDSKRKIEYQKRIARALMAQKKNNEAVEILADALKSKPDDAEARGMNAELLIDTDPAKASTELQQAIAKMPASPELRLNLGRALMAKEKRTPQDVDQAKFNFEEALRLAPNNIPARIGLGQALLMKQDYAGAIAAANAVLAANANVQGAKLLRALAQFQLANFAQARADLLELLGTNPQYPDAVLYLGIISLAEKNYAEAEQRFTKLLETAPQEYKAVAGLAQTYAAQRKFDKALALVNAQLARQSGPQSQLRVLLGDLALLSGNKEVAMSSFQLVTQKDPGYADAWTRLGLLYRTTGDLNKSIECLRKAKELQPATYQIASELGVTLERNGQRDEARKLYEEVLKTHPDDVIALNNLAYIIAESGLDLDRALMLVQKAKQKAPNHPDVADTLGWIYIRKQLTDPAIAIFRDLTSKHPENPSFHYHLAMALYQKGDKPEAKRALQSALQRKPSREEEVKIRDLMAKVG